MEHRDAEMAEVMIVLDKAYEERLADAVAMLQAAGLTVTEANDDNSVVNGTCETYIISTLKGLECVDYVRVVITWIADYPSGDPRDLDGAEEA